MRKISRRLDIFSESVIRRMTRIALASGAINLSQGYPDFPPPEELLRAAEKAAWNGPINMRLPGALTIIEKHWQKSKVILPGWK